MSDAALENVLRRDRAIVSAALVALTALAWVYILRVAGGMGSEHMDVSGSPVNATGMSAIMPAPGPWRFTEFALVLAMWIVMMVGMMTPSAAPMILLYAKVGRQASLQGKPFASSGWFLSGYLLTWAAFAVAATVAQFGLERATLLTPMTLSTNALLGGAVLIAAGLYEWTPLKDICLRQCQAPWAFIQRHGGFRREAGGSLRLGVLHGAYCVSCCWGLMALLFVGGVMNVLWILCLAALVLIEKLAPAGRFIARIAGAGFVASGAWLVVTALR